MSNCVGLKVLDGQVTLSLIELDNLREELKEHKEFIKKFKNSKKCILLTDGYNTMFPQVLATGNKEIIEYFKKLEGYHAANKYLEQGLYREIEKLNDTIRELKSKLPWWRKK